MVAFLLELGRILGEGRKDFHRFEGELARSLCASHMVGVDVDWSACALKRSSEHASGRVASRLFLVQDGQPWQLDETWARSMNLVFFLVLFFVFFLFFVVFVFVFLFLFVCLFVCL
jgi:hypothetical protein